MKEHIEQLAKGMYTDYSSAVGGKAYNGDPLPDAEEFFSDPTKQVQAHAWRAIAEKQVNILVRADRFVCMVTQAIHKTWSNTKLCNLKRWQENILTEAYSLQHTPIDEQHKHYRRRNPTG